MNINPFNILAPAADHKAGLVYLANEGAVANQFLSEPLTQFSVGWRSPDGVLEALLKMLCGEPVVVSKRFEYKKMNNSKAFAAVENDADVRAIGADFKRVTVGGDTVDAHTISKGLTLRIDRDELNDNPQAEQDAVAYLKTLLLRAEIIRAFTGLSGAATGGNATSKTWGTGANASDADADVMAHLQTLADDSGLLPNRAFFGSTAWQKRFTTLRASANTAVAMGATLTREQVAGLMALDSVHVCNERYQTSSGKSTLLSNNLVLLFNAQNSGIKDDPSNIKRFVTKVNGQDFAVFKKEEAAGVDVTVAHQSLIAIPSSLGIGKITVS